MSTDSDVLFFPLRGKILLSPREGKMPSASSSADGNKCAAVME